MFLQIEKILYYLIFNAVLLTFFTTMSAVSFHLNSTKLKLKLEESLSLMNSPELGLRPLPPNTDAKRIWYKAREKSNTYYWKWALDKYLQKYINPDNKENLENCQHMSKPDEGMACEFKIDNKWAPCIKEYGYGFDDDHGPCIFLELNKTRNWKPEYYNSSTIPDGMPEHLRKLIQDKEKDNEHHVVWVSCAGEDSADKENVGPIHYYPMRGFEGKYFPFVDVEGYQSPLVAVHFQNPLHGVLINIECKAWARNIKHDSVHRQGIVQFQLMID